MSIGTDKAGKRLLAGNPDAEKARVKQKIAARFGKAAATYTEVAYVQAQTAEALALKIQQSGIKPQKILEFGCGTGFLTEKLSHLFPESFLLATDLSFKMIEAARKNLENKNLQGQSCYFIAADAENFCFSPESFDLICGSLAAQWFKEPVFTLQKLQALLKPRGLLALTTLGPQTFSRWRALCALAGVTRQEIGLSLAELREARLPGSKILSEQSLTVYETCPSVQDFLSRLKKIGAAGGEIFAEDPEPISTGQFKKILQKSRLQKGFVADYEIITLLWQR